MHLPTEIKAEIIEYCATWQEIPRLKTLGALCLVSRAWKDVAQPPLWETAWYINPSKLKLEPFLTALRAYPRLGHFVKVVNIGGYRGPLLTAIQTIADSCPNLIRLIWPACPNLSDQCLHQLLAKWDRLENTFVYDSPRITEDGWMRAATFLTKLHTLRIHNAPNFGDKAVVALIDSCRLLKELWLFYTDITSDGVSYIMLNAPELDELFIETTSIELETIDEISWQRPAGLEFYVRRQNGPYNNWS
ncbi:hypothetical protein DFS34DRAFT_645784 [Phlyctochytrium arcticum]|nr:hypothetical protein DFS34DRAFT_645784 [Phlyctochytrium arcticum]